MMQDVSLKYTEIGLADAGPISVSVYIYVKY